MLPNNTQPQAKQYAPSVTSTYAASTFSTNTSSTLKPLVNPSSSSKSGFRQKTKKFLSSIGEPPTAAYERKQAAAMKDGQFLTETEKATLSQKQLDRLEEQRRTQMTFAMDYGPMSRGGTTSGFGFDRR